MQVGSVLSAVSAVLAQIILEIGVHDQGAGIPEISFWGLFPYKHSRLLCGKSALPKFSDLS